MKQITRKEIEGGMILFCKSGSHAYGLNTETSDYDYKGICIAPQRYYLTLLEFEQKDKGWDDDCPADTKFPWLSGSDSQVYELRRYLRLVQSQNPNILEMLWQEPEDYLYRTSVGEILLESRHNLLTKKISGTFIQYARAQIKKMHSHRKWLLEPPTSRPKWEDYGVDSPNFTNEQIEAFIEYLYMILRDRVEYYQEAKDLYEIIHDKVDWKGILKQNVLPDSCLEMTQELTRANKDFMSLLKISQQYRADLKRWSNYQDWLKNRNVKRSEIEKICGYDGKNASHCIRLLKMAIEAMKTGELIVNRDKAGDRDLLIDIKTGRLSYQEVDQMVDDLFEEAEYVVANNCILPSKLDDDFINSLCERIVWEYGHLNNTLNNV
jgi:predicted nucleotidyltransferase